MNRLVFLASPALLAGCHSSLKNPANSDETVTMNGQANGQVSFNFPFAQGHMKIPESMMKNGQFDIDGVKMIPGGTLNGFNVNAGDNGSTVNIGFKSPASAKDTQAYFLDQFRQKGVEAAAAGDSITGKLKDGNTFVVHVTSAAAQGSTGTIQIQSKS
jgi:hypothetical protein